MLRAPAAIHLIKQNEDFRGICFQSFLARITHSSVNSKMLQLSHSQAGHDPPAPLLMNVILYVYLSEFRGHRLPQPPHSLLKQTAFGGQTQQMLAQVLLHLRTAKILPPSELLPRWPHCLESRWKVRRRKIRS